MRENRERRISMSGFRDLKVWQRAKKMAVEIYKITQTGKFKHDYSFKVQISERPLVYPAILQREMKEVPIAMLFVFSTSRRVL